MNTTAVGGPLWPQEIPAIYHYHVPFTDEGTKTQCPTVRHKAWGIHWPQAETKVIDSLWICRVQDGGGPSEAREQPVNSASSLLCDFEQLP